MRAFVAMIGLLIAGPVLAKPVAKPLEWGFQGTVFSGYVIYDDYSAAIRPGIAMVPNSMGVNASAIEKAKPIAGTDYVVLLVDMYDTGVRAKDTKDSPTQAR